MPNENTEVPNRLAVHLVLDRSGSMRSNTAQTINAFNSYVSQLAEETPDARFSLTLFDSRSIDTIVAKVPAKDVNPLNEETYVPRGGTPLYDAIGFVVPKLAGQESEDKVLVILTDGLENASREFTKDIVRKILAEKQAQGWLVLFLGADIDAFDEGRKVGADARSTMNFSKAGFQKTADAAYASTRRFRNAKAAGFGIDEVLRRAGFTDEERRRAMEDDDFTF